MMASPDAAATAAPPLLSIRDLRTAFTTDDGVVSAVNGVSFDVGPGETVGLVGESGSGKSVCMLSVLGLLPNSAEVSGSAQFRGRELIGLRHREMRRIRGRDIGLVFQDAMAAFNPVLRVGDQIAEGIRWHRRDLSAAAIRRHVVRLLEEVGIPNAAVRARQYPHEFSGGMRQRAIIAMALANRPQLVIADEPTTALDVTLQAQILMLLRQVQSEVGAGLIMITHDLDVVAEMADRVVVMYAGRVVETADVDAVFHDARHPYTRGLLESRPSLAADARRLPAIAGHPPDARRMPDGCAFRARCSLSQGRRECLAQPPLTPRRPGHSVACHFDQEFIRPQPADGAR